MMFLAGFWALYASFGLLPAVCGITGIALAGFPPGEIETSNHIPNGYDYSAAAIGRFYAARIHWVKLPCIAAMIICCWKLKALWPPGTGK